MTWGISVHNGTEDVTGIVFGGVVSDGEGWL